MTDVSVQLAAAAICALAGISGGVLYEGVEILRKFSKNKILLAAGDVIFFLLFAALFAAMGAFFCLPFIRLYMFLAAGIGFFLYRKSLHRILAFFAVKLYNRRRRFPKRTHTGDS